MESCQIIGLTAIAIALLVLVVVSIIHILTSDSLSFEVSIINLFLVPLPLVKVT